MNVDFSASATSPVATNVETSVYMIKPEAMSHRHEIRSMIAKHLDLGARSELVLPVVALDALYPDLSTELRAMTHEMFRAHVEIGLVHGPNAIAMLLDIAGHHTAPHLCEPDTVRHRFGRWTPSLCGGATYYHNGIHRPKDATEARQHVALLFPSRVEDVEIYRGRM